MSAITASIYKIYNTNVSTLYEKFWNLSCNNASFDCVSITSASFNNISSINSSFDSLYVYNLSCVNEIIDPAIIYNLSILYNCSAYNMCITGNCSIHNASIVNLDVICLALLNSCVKTASFQMLMFHY